MLSHRVLDLAHEYHEGRFQLQVDQALKQVPRTGLTFRLISLDEDCTRK